MKIILCILGVCLFFVPGSLEAWSQTQEVVYYENFQASAFPNDILLVNKDNQLPVPAPMKKSKEAWVIGSHPGDPSRSFAMTSSRFGNGMQADRWMILPAIGVPENAVLRWQVRSSAINPQNWEDYQVLVSPGGTDTGGDFMLLFEETAPYNDASQDLFTPWSNRELDLSDYSGEEIRLAFRAVGQNGFLLFVDEIALTGLSPISFALERVVAQKYNSPGGIRLEGRLRNTGREVIHSFDVRLEDEQGRVLAAGEFRNQAVGSNRTLDFGFPPFDMNEEGLHRIKCIISDPNGGSQHEGPENQKKTDIVVIRESAPRHVLMEFYTGTWCGHCPKGVLTAKRLLEKQDHVIPAFIHHRDIFAIDDADSLIAYMPNGYPSATFDRFNLYDTPRPAINNYTDDSWQRAVTKRLASPSPVEIGLSHSFDPKTRVLDVRARIRFVAETTGIFRVNMMITEDDVRSSVYEQLNYANADPNWPELNRLGNPIPDYRHDHVVRKFAFGPWGKAGAIPEIPQVGEVYMIASQFVIPDDWKTNDLYVLAYVSEHSVDVQVTEVLNAIREKVTGEQTGSKNAGRETAPTTDAAGTRDQWENMTLRSSTNPMTKQMLLDLVQ